MKSESGRTFKSPVLRALVLFLTVGIILVVVTDPSSKNLNPDGKLMANVEKQATPAVEGKTSMLAHRECVEKLTNLAKTADGTVDSLFSSFPVASDANLLYVSSDGAPKSATHEEIGAALEDDKELRSRVKILAQYAADQHKILSLGAESLFIYPDNTVVRADAASCAIKQVLLGDGYDFHPKMKDVMREHIHVAEDKKKEKAPKVCEKRRLMRRLIDESDKDDVDAKFTHDECMDRLQQEIRLEHTASKAFADSVVEVGMPDGSVKPDQKVAGLSKDPKASPLMTRVESQLAVDNHKQLAVGKKTIVLFPDNTVVTVDTSTCHVRGVYFSKEKEYHPKVKAMMVQHGVSADKKKKKPKKCYGGRRNLYLKIACAPSEGPRCWTYVYRNRATKSFQQSECRKYNANPVGDTCAHLRGLKYCSSMFCKRNNRPAYICQERVKNGRNVLCWANTQTKSGSKHSQNCRTYGVSFASHSNRCPSANCCQVRLCPLLRAEKASCKRPDDPESIADTGTVVTNVVSGVQVGLAVGQLVAGIVETAMGGLPIVSGILGVFGAAMGFAGNAAMTGETALNKAKEYTNKLVQEVYSCMDQRFALAWEQHMDKAANTLNVIIESGDLLNSAPNLKQQRLQQVWEPADIVCIQLSSLFHGYVKNFVGTSDNSHRVALKGLFFMRTCTASYTAMMLDQLQLRMTPATSLNRMRAVNYEILRLVQLAMATFKPYYTNKAKCGSLSVVNERYKWMTQNVLKPAAIIAQTSYGGKLHETVVLEFRRRYISARVATRVTGKNIRNAVRCKEECVAMGSTAPNGRGKKCYAIQYDARSKRCIAYLSPITTNNLRYSAHGTVYIVSSRSKAAVPVGNSNQCCRAHGIVLKDDCLQKCARDSRCIATRICGRSCCNVRTNTARLPSHADYVLFHGAEVVEMRQFTYNGNKGRAIRLNPKQCLMKCAQSTNCVAADSHPGNWCYLMYAGRYGYPDPKKQLVFKKGNNGYVHWDIFRSSQSEIYSARLPLFSDMDVLASARPLRGLVLKEYEHPAVEQKEGDWSFQSALDWMNMRKMEAEQE